MMRSGRGEGLGREQRRLGQTRASATWKTEQQDNGQNRNRSRVLQEYYSSGYPYWSNARKSWLQSRVSHSCGLGDDVETDREDEKTYKVTLMMLKFTVPQKFRDASSFAFVVTAFIKEMDI